MTNLTFKDLYLDSTSFPKAGDGPFEVPPMILSKPQFLFGFHVVVLYEDDNEARTELCHGFGVTIQALWTWRKEGLPFGRKEQAEQLIADPNTRFRLASNVTLDQLVRPVAQRKQVRRDVKPHKKWLDLLSKIETGEFSGLTRKDIPRLLDCYTGPPLPKWSPYKWGWNNEGVPPSYAKYVWKAMIEMGFPRRMKMRENEFIEYCEKNFKAKTRLRKPGSLADKSEPDA